MTIYEHRDVNYTVEHRNQDQRMHAFCIQSRDMDSGLIYITEKQCGSEGGKQKWTKGNRDRKRGQKQSPDKAENQDRIIRTEYSKYKKLLMVSSKAVSFSKNMWNIIPDSHDYVED